MNTQHIRMQGMPLNQQTEIYSVKHLYQKRKNVKSVTSASTLKTRKIRTNETKIKKGVNKDNGEHQ